MGRGTAVETSALTKHVALCLVVLLTSGGCGYLVARELAGVASPVPADFSFLGDQSACYLEVQGRQMALRVNCFHINGTLHIHSSRWARLPRLSGESWTVTVRRTPEVRVQIEDKIYRLQAFEITNETTRRQILFDRGYWHAWAGISIFAFHPR